MPVSLPYLASNKNVSNLFEKISSARIPPKFTHDFLRTTIGLKGTNDRSLIPLLRSLGFLDQSGTPTEKYSLLKSKEKSKAAIAAGVRTAYGPLFNADESANELSGEKLKSLVAQVAGTDDDMTGRTASTFAALTRLGDFKADAAKPSADDNRKDEDEDSEQETDRDTKKMTGLRTEFHYNIQIHLPSNGTEETYLNTYTSGHSRRVALASEIIAKALGLPQPEVERVTVAALLHDVGKIDERFGPILAKEGRLTPEEWEIMKQHPIRGSQLVGLLSSLKDIVAPVRHHHENWDGTGYPDGLRGEKIPLASRIIMFADTLDAITTDRPYRKALGIEEARAEFLRFRAKQFDPTICDRVVSAAVWSELYDTFVGKARQWHRAAS